ncbi:MAG: arylsulfatase A-like enzyme, partial [Planctomycetota bacterium]
AARLERIAERKRARATADSPSIVFVVMDTLRADRTSLHGYEKPTTPVLDSLAERGVTFERAYSTSSWTWPSTASLLTGLAPEAHGVTSSRSCFLAHELETLPERLQQRGYTTAAFAANPLIAPDKNFDQGFESFSATRSRFLPSDVVVPDVLEWLDRNAGRRFFLYVHLVDPHEPHKPRPEFERSMTSGKPADLPEGALTKYGEAMLRMSDEERARHVPPEHARWMSEVYDASVATGDYWFGQILEKLNELQLRDNTIVAFTSDHGEELLEHGMLKHGHALWEELVHVPLVIAGPGIAQGVRISTPLSNRELPLSLAVRAGAPFEAIDARLDLTRPGELVEEDVFFSTENGWLNGKRDQTIIGIRDDAWTVHFRPPHKANEELRVLGSYDNTTDPMQLRAWSASDEERNSSQPRVERALRQVSRWREHAPQVRAAGAGTIDVLRGVGYLGDED